VNLSQIELDNNLIEELPEGIKWRCIESFCPTQNRLAAIPAGVCSLKNLIRVDLSKVSEGDNTINAK